MREIKFRAFDLSTKTMHSVDCLSGLNYKPRCEIVVDEVYIDDCLFTGDKPEAILMQSTGLKDKNGAEIFEGDIVLSNGGTKVTPIFQNGVYMAYLVEHLNRNEKEPMTQFNVIWKNKCEVIGNIYENPELLEQEE
jgi:uncharacterized phage protein (TIGR01671 family)